MIYRDLDSESDQIRLDLRQLKLGCESSISVPGQVSPWVGYWTALNLFLSVQKIRHLIESTKCVNIYTNHKSAKDGLISKTLQTSSTVCQNLQLICTS